jgi:type II secretory pathway component PulK
MRLRIRRSDRRSAVVLLAVLVAIVVLSLSAYQFSDRTAAEWQAADNAHQLVQARCFADSGVHMAAALLADPDNIDEMLGGNPYDNPDHFRDAPITPQSGLAGKFTLIAPPDPDDPLNSSQSRYGVTDEGGKINLNSMMKVDPTGDTLYNALLKLPNMTEEIAAAIVDWIDPDSTPRENGAESDAYSGNTPSYRCKNGPLDSLDELLLVRGVTRDLLYGSDLNRNGVHDPDEAARGEYVRGWSAFLTVHSHEPNRDALGQTLLWINDPDLATLYEKLAPEVGDEFAKFIILYRQYGPANSTGQQQSMGGSLAALFGGGKRGGSSSSSQSSAQPVQGNLSDVQLNLNKLPAKKINSMFDLAGVQVSIASKTKGQPATVYQSPLNDLTMAKDLLGKLFMTATLFENSIVPARINVNTAPKEVLSAIPEITDADVQLILSARSQASFNSTPAYLLTDGGLKLDTLRKIEKYVTTRTQVFRVHSVGQFADGKGPMARIEAIIDTNYGRPRIVQWRDWTELGKTSMPQQ